MFKHILSIIFLLTLFACGQDSNKIGNKDNIDSASTVRPDSSTKSKGVLKWNRKYLSREAILPTSIIKYITNGHEAIDSAVGDINGDNILDLLLVTSTINEDSLRTNSIINDKRINFDSVPLKRQLLVLTGQRDGSYKLECKNLNAIPCLDCCGMTDPFGGISLKNGQIIITEYCASNCIGISEYSFKYSGLKKNWYLEQVIEESYCFDYEDYSCDTTTTKDFNKISINKFDIDKGNE